ncbi:transcription factor bHLH154-like [Nymphaea colorata]|nr:transcription factor bHLH154-like [Nymphaea colorata]
MTELKRRASSLEGGANNCDAIKKYRTEGAMPRASIKARNEKFSEKITALQQLVSPFGKTDTASVLTEAMGYIKFLHDQIQVLSAPYLRGTPVEQLQAIDCSLRSRGLCLVPISYTLNVAQSNGADIWAPVMANPKF